MTKTNSADISNRKKMMVDFLPVQNGIGHWNCNLVLILMVIYFLDLYLISIGCNNNCYKSY